MASLLVKMQEYYHYLFYDLCDYRSRDLSPSPPFLITILLSYLYFSLSLGPRLMQGVKPFELKSSLIVYNFVQIIASGYLFYTGLSAGWLDQYSWTCQPVDMTENPNSRRMLNGIWLYTVIKLVDLLDTVFFVLRKKERQISFLHVYHHFMMPIAAYFGLKYFPNGHSTLIGVINSFVHVVMYTYYFLAGLGPQFQKYLWWKKYVTVLQLVQFIIVFLHQAAAIHEDCGYPKWISVILCIQSINFIIMFGKFYYVSYIVNSKKKHVHGNVINSKAKVN